MNNGGGLGEIAFTEVWANLEQIMRPLADSFVVKEAIDRRPHLPFVKYDPAQTQDFKIDWQSGLVTIAPRLLATAVGQPISRVEMLTLALNILQSCEGRLTNLDFKLLAETLLTFRFYDSAAFADGTVWTVVLRRASADNFALLTDREGISFGEKIAGKLRVALADLRFDRISVDRKPDSMRVTGEVSIAASVDQLPNVVKFSITVTRTRGAPYILMVFF